MALPDAVLAAEAASNQFDAVRGREMYFGYCGSCTAVTVIVGRGRAERLEPKNGFRCAGRIYKNPRSPMPKTFPTPLNEADERNLRDIVSFIMQWR